MNNLVNFDGLEPLPAANICSLSEDEQETLAGWCPNGGLSGGVCKPFNNVREDWMSRYSGARSLRIQDCILPGTHHSGFDKEAANTPSMETCQDVSPLKQLRAGIRVLDLRVQFFSGYGAGIHDAFRFSTAPPPAVRWRTTFLVGLISSALRLVSTPRRKS